MYATLFPVIRNRSARILQLDNLATIKPLHQNKPNTTRLDFFAKVKPTAEGFTGHGLFISEEECKTVSKYSECGEGRYRGAL